MTNAGAEGSEGEAHVRNRLDSGSRLLGSLRHSPSVCLCASVFNLTGFLLCRAGVGGRTGGAGRIIRGDFATFSGTPPRMTMSTATEFVPASLDATRFENVEPIIRALLARRVESAADLERWLLDRSELDAACNESRANLYIAMTCDTADPAKAQAYTRFIEEVSPKLEPLAFELDKRQAELSKRYGGMHTGRGGRYEVMTRDVTANVEVFRQENVPIQTELEKLAQDYQTITGAMTVTFDGAEKTLPQMGKYQEVTDRAVREAAWRAVAERRLRDRDAIEAVPLLCSQGHARRPPLCPVRTDAPFRLGLGRSQHPLEVVHAAARDDGRGGPWQSGQAPQGRER